jgi:hypothetical protein
MMNYKPKKLGLPSSTGIVKPPTLPAPPAPRAPAPVAAPPIVKPPLAYKPPAPPSNSGVVKPTNLPPPINEPLDRRGAPTLPNDRPAPVVPPPTPAPPPLNYKPPIAPAPILPGDVPMPDKGGAQRPEPVLKITPPTPIPAPPPVLNPPLPPAPPPPVPVPDRGFPTRPDPVNPNNGPTKGGDIPVDPSGGRGQVPDTDPRSEKYVRRNETTEQRIKRLEAKLRARGGKDADLEARIARLKERLAGGEVKPSDPSQDTPKTPRVQLDDDPSTWTPEMLAELALPRGMDTIFYDNPNSSDKVKTAKRIADPDEGGGDGTGDNAKVNQTRQDETTQERIARLQAKLKGASKEKKAQLKARIAKLKARRDGGENTPKPDQGKNKPTPTSQVPDAKKDKKGNKDTNETRQDEDLEDRLSRLRAKLKGMKANDPKRKQLEQRIKDLEARIKQGDKKGSSTKNQPGTPERPYRNREVSSRPFNYGGTLRI